MLEINSYSIVDSKEFSKLDFACSKSLNTYLEKKLQELFPGQLYLQMIFKQLLAMDYIINKAPSRCVLDKPSQKHFQYLVNQITQSRKQSIVMLFVKFLLIFLIKQRPTKALLNVSELRFEGLTTRFELENICHRNDILRPISSFKDFFQINLNKSPMIFSGLLGIRSKILLSICFSVDEKFYKNINKLKTIKRLINWSIQRDEIATSRLVKRMNYCQFITGGDQSIYSRMVINSIKENRLSTKYISISHGWSHEKNLEGIIPIYGDIHYAWTKNVADEMRKVLPESERKKIGFFYPKVHFSCIRNKKRTALFCLAKLDKVIRTESKMLDAWISKLLSLYDKVLIRLHPKDIQLLNSPEFAKLLRLKHKRIELSRTPEISTDFKIADVVYTVRSSVIIESYMSGLQTFLITDLLKPCLTDLSVKITPVKLLSMSQVENKNE